MKQKFENIDTQKSVQPGWLSIEIAAAYLCIDVDEFKSLNIPSVTIPSGIERWSTAAIDEFMNSLSSHTNIISNPTNTDPDQEAPGDPLCSKGKNSMENIMSSVQRLVPKNGAQPAQIPPLPAILEFDGLRYPTSGHWPPTMRADMAAAYTDMKNVKTFREAVRIGLLPQSLPWRVKKFQVWAKQDLDDYLGISTKETNNIDHLLT